ncbi:MAG: hypothetical protein ACI89W_000527 [Gammaproteobacteria bacterium]|jgi:hypothetical protein
MVVITVFSIFVLLSVQTNNKQFKTNLHNNLVKHTSN